MRRLVLVALAACGGDPRDRTIDAPLADARADALGPSSGDAAAGAVTMHVTQLRQAVANATVYFQNADSTLVRGVLTDENGSANATMVPGGFVTVIAPRIGSERMRVATFSAVQPGDALELDLEPVGPSDSANVNVAIDADNRPNLTGHRVVTTCGSILVGDPAQVTPGQLAGCGGAADAFVVSFDDSGTPIAGHFHSDLAIVDTSTLTLTGTYVAFEDRDVQYKNVPNEIGFMGVHQAIVTARGVLVEFSAGGASVLAATIPVRGPVTTGTTSVLSSTPFPDSAAEPGTQILHRWAPTPASFTIDVTAERLPPFSTRGQYDVAAHAITWDELSATLEPDVVRARLDIVRDGIPQATAWTWRVFAPRTGKSITLPTLPDDGFDFNARADDTVTIDELATARLPGVELATIRQNPFVAFRSFIAGASGSLVEQNLTAQEPIEKPGKRTARRR